MVRPDEPYAEVATTDLLQRYIAHASRIAVLEREIETLPGQEGGAKAPAGVTDELKDLQTEANGMFDELSIRLKRVTGLGRRRQG
jgi:hypothetical protein